MLTGMPSLLAQLFLWLLLLSTSSSQQCSGSAGVCLANGEEELSGKHEVIEGTEIVWQRPAGTDKPKGVLLTFHGCSHSATDWFPASDTCKECIGLPEEVRISRTALSRGYVLLAISSRDRSFGKCWGVPHFVDRPSIDIHSVSAVLQQMLPREGLEGTPLYALGASSGGAFVLTLPAFIPLAGVCAQIMALPLDWYKDFLAGAPAADKTGGAVRPTAPALFVHMPRDTHTAALVKNDIGLREMKGAASHEIEVQPQPITAEFLVMHMPELAADGRAKQLVTLFQEKQLLDGEGRLARDPRHSDWRDIVKASSIQGAADWDLTPDKSGLSEVFNVAWAGHEIISDTTHQMLDWFEQQPHT